VQLNELEGPCGCCFDSVPCLCPECPVCGSSGDPHCYPAHGLRYDSRQLQGQLAAVAWRKYDRFMDYMAFQERF